MVAVQTSRTDPKLVILQEEVRKGLDLVLNRLPDVSQQRDSLVGSLASMEGSIQELGGGIRDLQDQLQVRKTAI